MSNNLLVQQFLKAGGSFFVALTTLLVGQVHAQSAGEVNGQTQYYSLQTLFTGDNKCLDIINDGQDNKLTMAQCGNYSGQFWKIKNP